MSLQISNKNGTFNLTGKINTTTASAFKTHMKFVFKTQKEVVINIDNVQEIDVAGVSTLKELYMHALVYNKTFYITGNGCKDIYHDFRYHNVA